MLTKTDSYADGSQGRGPVQKSFSWVRIALLAAAIVVVVIGFYFLFQRTNGNCLMGTTGIVGMYFVAATTVLLAFIAVPALSRQIGKLTTMLGRIAAAIGLAVLAVILAWMFVVNPVLDVPYLADPSSVELTDVEADFNTSGESVFYHLSGTDSEGRLRTFTVDRAVSEGWDAEVTEATVTYLPNSKTVLDIDPQ